VSNLILRTDGTILYEYNEEDGKKKDRVVEYNKILAYLGMRTDIEEGFKVKHLFEILENYPILKETNPYINHFIDDFNTDPTSKQSELTSINIQRLFTKEAYRERKTNDCSCNAYIDVFGLDDNYKEEGGPTTRFSTSFIGLDELREADLNVLPGCYTAYSRFKSKKYKKLLKKKKPTYLQIEFCTTYSLFEIIETIFWDFSFHGVKEEREVEKEKLDDIVKELEGKSTKQLMKEGKLVSGKNVFKKLKKKMKKRRNKNKEKS
jgi:hypothetical protein